MKNYTLFNYDFLFGDHFAKVSDQAKLLYIKMSFYAVNGFVANPLAIVDSLGYDKSVLDELVANEDILRLPDRSEVFITSFFVHNKGANYKSWWNSPFSIYWKGKLFIKSNGVCTFKPQSDIDSQDAVVDAVCAVAQTHVDYNDPDWDSMMAGFESAD